MAYTVVHLSDTHLGYSDLDKVNKQGVNLREQDFYDSFTRVIDDILKLKPDAVIHTGDFFNRPSPANRPMVEAMTQLKRVSEAGIPFVVISGNHSTPRTVFTSPILKAFRAIDHVYPVFNQQYEYMEIGDLIIHGIPHINDDQTFAEQIDLLVPQPDKINILMMHTSIGKKYIMEQYGEKILNENYYEILNKFDYVALGHWHNFQQVSQLKNAWYCGSTERLSETETSKEKGYVILKFDTGKPVEIEFKSIKTRPFFRLDIKNCDKKSSDQIKDEIEKYAADNDTEGAVVHIYFHNLSQTQAVDVSNRWLTEVFKDALAVKPKRKYYTHGSGEIIDAKTESLDVIFEQFVKDKVKDKETQKTMIDLGKQYFSEYEEQVSL